MTFFHETQKTSALVENDQHHENISILGSLMIIHNLFMSMFNNQKLYFWKLVDLQTFLIFPLLNNTAVKKLEAP